MATSKTDICNRALARINGDLIQDIDSSSPSTNERICATFFQPTLDSFIVDVKPNGAITRQKLVLSADTPTYGYDYAYVMPTSPRILQLLKFNDTDVTNDYRKNYVIENGLLLTDEADVYITYLRQLTDVSVLQPLQFDALVSRLASVLIPIIKPDDLNTLQLINNEYNINKSKAMFNDNAYQNKPVENRVINSVYIAAKRAKY